MFATTWLHVTSLRSHAAESVLSERYSVMVWKVDFTYSIPLVRLEQACSCFRWGEASEARASSGPFGNLKSCKTLRLSASLYPKAMDRPPEQYQLVRRQTPRWYLLTADHMIPESSGGRGSAGRGETRQQPRITNCRGATLVTEEYEYFRSI